MWSVTTRSIYGSMQRDSRADLKKWQQGDETKREKLLQLRKNPQQESKPQSFAIKTGYLTGKE